ncbi:hypothetical protein [Microbacterium foliorum]|uniref:Uncharacterized protein n=1 Tax=Microbacterium foliorum TaxID=104336 RepID=A0A0F0KVF9_9MICO|nr:hypothetical protein [Microbacterium foliorum]KJL24100.1 hypothetical protein RN50_00858 [Microbacterium foliorum]
MSITGSTDRNFPSTGSYVRAPTVVRPVDAVTGLFIYPVPLDHTPDDPIGAPYGSRNVRVVVPAAVATVRTSTVPSRFENNHVNVVPVVPDFADFSAIGLPSAPEYVRTPATTVDPFACDNTVSPGWGHVSQDVLTKLKN